MIAEARAGLFPTINANPTLTRSGPPGGNNLDAEVTGSWTIDLWGRVRREIEQYGAAAQVSKADLDNATLSEQSSLALAYVQVRAGRRTARSARGHGQGVSALARHHAKPVQRGHHREIGRHHRAGASARRAGAGDQHRRCAPAERARHRGADGQAAVGGLGLASRFAAECAASAGVAAVDVCSSAGPTSPPPSAR